MTSTLKDAQDQHSQGIQAEGGGGREVGEACGTVPAHGYQEAQSVLVPAAWEGLRCGQGQPYRNWKGKLGHLDFVLGPAEGST